MSELRKLKVLAQTCYTHLCELQEVPSITLPFLLQRDNNNNNALIVGLLKGLSDTGILKEFVDCKVLEKDK